MPKIRLTKVHCLATGETGKNGDDLYIRYRADSGLEQRFPTGTGSGMSNIKAGEDWNVDLVISYRTALRIDLYDNDTTSANDYLGYHNYNEADAEAPHVYNTNSDRDGQYEFYTEPVATRGGGDERDAPPRGGPGR
ncbi:hypothetical protein [Haliangium sp.]|uniref:hypothetical protein n=1 Tax=Haliangium sp. TaxID=2663208 RepID=UPI003D0FEE5D